MLGNGGRFKSRVKRKERMGFSIRSFFILERELVISAPR